MNEERPSDGPVGLATQCPPASLGSLAGAVARRRVDRLPGRGFGVVVNHEDFHAVTHGFHTGLSQGPYQGAAAGWAWRDRSTPAAKGPLWATCAGSAEYDSTMDRDHATMRHGESFLPVYASTGNHSQVCGAPAANEPESDSSLPRRRVAAVGWPAWPGSGVVASVDAWNIATAATATNSRARALTKRWGGVKIQEPRRTLAVLD